MRTPLRRMRRPAAAVLLLTGCFYYAPADVSAPPSPRTEVRVTLSRPMDIPMGEFTLHSVNRIEGIVAEAGGDTLDLYARWLHPQTGRKHDAMMGTYHIPVGQIQQLERWRVSGKRTALVAAVAAVSVVFLVDLAFRSLGGNDPPGPPPDNQSIAAPRWR